jgi:hypothetical protein
MGQGEGWMQLVESDLGEGGEERRDAWRGQREDLAHNLISLSLSISLSLTHTHARAHTHTLGPGSAVTGVER